MCDTLVALGSATDDGVTLFAKNSDREPNEAHYLLQLPRSSHAPGSSVQCTYVAVPQVPETYAVLLAKPFQIWGAEMGANEHGVVLGNEAVFTRVPYNTGPGLTGMDLLRLALERARTAAEARTVITDLLAQHGQGGSGGYRHALYYHNSFLIADPHDAWVLETAGPHWAAVQVRDVRSISNGLTIGQDWDVASPDLVAYAVDRGWCRGHADFHFARCYSDFLYTRFSAGRARRARTTAALAGHDGRFSVAGALQALRDHRPGARWSPARGLTGADVCMHASFGLVRASQTTGSMVSHLAPDVQTHFVTGTAAPCTSIFKPVWLDAGLPETGPAPSGTYDAATLFWRHEALHRATLRDYAVRHALYAGERDALEHEFLAGARDCRTGSPEERAAFSEECFAAAAAAEARWLERVQATGPRDYPGRLYTRAWHRFDAEAGMAGDGVTG